MTWRAATSTDEYFDTFDDAGRPTGPALRAEVHARGLWHRSAHVFLFTADDELWIQRRAPGKDLYPGRWDFSVGEHLRPGESYLEGARRGLAEELGVSGVELTPLAAVRRNVCRIDALGLVDREYQQAFRGCHDGPVTPDPAEVSDVARITLPALTARIRQAPDDFTPWLRSELDHLGRLLDPRAQNSPS